MQLIQNQNKNNYSIQNYSSGEISVNNIPYTHSLIILSEKIISDWPPQTIAMLAVQHLNTILQLTPEIILIGTGTEQHFLSSSLMAHLINAKIGFEIMNTAAACRTFNLLASEGRKVAAGLIIK